MKGSFAYADFDVLADLWRRQVPEKYAVDAALLRSHTVGSPLLDLDLSHWLTFADKLRGFITIKRSPAELYAGPNPTVAQINSLVFENFDYAKQLLDAVLEPLRSKGFTQLVFGTDSLHFFPGCPQDWPQMKQFLLESGFVEGDTEQFDVERSLVDYAAPEGVLERIVEPYVARTCTSDDLPALRAFFETSFSGRWRHDVLEKWNMEGPETVFGLFDTSAGTCVGFALLQCEGCQMPIGGAVWHQDLGAKWGSLGPIGVSESVRGKGLGDGLLAAGLVELQRRGTQRCIIDWTTLVDFYGKHGFTVNRRYVGMTLTL